MEKDLIQIEKERSYKMACENLSQKETIKGGGICCGKSIFGTKFDPAARKTEGEKGILV